jgi:hypothetical protein
MRAGWQTAMPFELVAVVHLKLRKPVMTNTTISIPVDDSTALAYSQASVEQQQKIQLLLRLRVRELFSPSDVSLQQIMDDIGAKAEARGLTPQILETLLGDE